MCHIDFHVESCNEYLEEMANYRMPSGRVAQFVKQLKRRNTYVFVYEDDGTPVRDRQLYLTWENARFLKRES
jgi:hypothetical protein